MTWRETTLLVWMFLAAGLLGGQLSAMTSNGKRPGLGSIVQAVAANRVARVVLVLGWMWLGWHTFAR